MAASGETSAIALQSIDARMSDIQEIAQVSPFSHLIYTLAQYLDTY